MQTITEETAIAVPESTINAITEVARPVRAIASFDTSTPEGAKRAYNASNGADEKLADHIGDTLNVTGYYMYPVELVNPQTGETEYAPSIVLYTAEGVTYSTVSKGVQGCIDRLAALGVISDENPCALKVAEKRAKLGRMLYLEMV